MNAYGIPELDPALCADRLVAPVTKWGTRRRTDPMPGTWHCYANDFHFTHLKRWPDQLAITGCAVSVEPNFTTHDRMPTVELLWLTHQKRKIARRWQELGVRIIVDLNVCMTPEAREINLLGVPDGWSAYATRAHKGVSIVDLEEEFMLATRRAGREDILFVVFGGTGPVKKHCAAVGWVHCQANKQTRRLAHAQD
jgi:hypothetical protein